MRDETNSYQTNEVALGAIQNDSVRCSIWRIPRRKRLPWEGQVCVHMHRVWRPSEASLLLPLCQHSAQVLLQLFCHGNTKQRHGLKSFDILNPKIVYREINFCSFLIICV